MLLDYQMPERDGIATLKKMKDDPVLRQLRIVMLTGASDRETVKEVITAGAAGYIAKQPPDHPRQDPQSAAQVKLTHTLKEGKCMGMKSEIEQALETHAVWRKRFKDFLNGRASFDASTASANDQCQFGKWLNREGYRLMPSELFGDIRVAHDEFHRVAGDIVQKIKDKRFADARDDLAPDGPFNRASVCLSGLLRKATLRAPGNGSTASAAAPPGASEEPPPSA